LEYFRHHLQNLSQAKRQQKKDKRQKDKRQKKTHMFYQKAMHKYSSKKHKVHKGNSSDGQYSVNYLLQVDSDFVQNQNEL